MNCQINENENVASYYGDFCYWIVQRTEGFES